jgi:threonylcarbamoyladenosine tRNA methylthiotransferase MtaB
MESLPVSQYHVFSYSERPGTKALNIPTVVSPEKKHQRTQQIINLSNNKLHTYYNIYIGQTRPVLLEKSSTSCQNHRIMSGFTDNYIRVDVSLPIESEQMKANDIVQVRLGDWNESKDALIGEII